MHKILYWAGLTASQPFNTGVQRVTRCLARELQNLGIEIVPVKWNGELNCVTSLNEAECEHLWRWSGPRLSPVKHIPKCRWLILPEITYPMVPPGSNVAAWAKRHGIKTAAVFYDMIPLKTRELYDDETINGLTQYWRMFSEADIALPISNTVAPDLENWLHEQGLKVPILKPCLLSGEVPGRERITTTRPPADRFNLLAIGTWEPRKNYPLILRAIRKARSISGKDIRITIAGRHARTEFPDLHAEIEGLAADFGFGVVSLRSQVGESEMAGLTNSVHATVFGSYLEGFGLPVLESIWQGRPCFCHNGSALAEIAPGGGTVMVDMRSEDDLAKAIARVASDPHELQRLNMEAVQRPMRTWADYAQDVLSAISDHRRLSGFFDFLGPRKLRQRAAPGVVDGI